MKKYYDRQNNRLVFIQQQANAEFWDDHWKNYDPLNTLPKYSFIEDYVTKTTKSFLPLNALILEGGCGLGQQVYKLQKKGYRVTGIDFATKTVELVNKKMPELDIRYGDITAIEFPDNYFDGYWSFGVIEHFYEGYKPVMLEMKRIVKPGGFVFLSFPHLSRLRKIKIKFNKYEEFKPEPSELKQFYQFALDFKKVAQEFESEGFKLVYKKSLDGLKGLKDELGIFRKPMQKLYDSRNFFGMAIAKIISLLVCKFASHSILLVLRKNN